METRSRLRVTTWEEGREQSWKEEEGTRQGTCMNDPQTWTTRVEIDCGSQGVGWVKEDLL